MLRIETSSVYSAMQGELGIESRGTIDVRSHTIGGFNVYCAVAGLQPYDFAIFGNELSVDGMRRKQDWLVADYSGGEAILVNSTPLLADPESYVTPHLKRLVKRIGPIEASELGIDALICFVYSKNER